MPVDAQPTLDGRVVLYDRGGSVVARVLAKDERPDPGTKTRSPHHMTCPEGASWRRGRSGRHG
jgi:hypothetical protein